MIRTRQSTEARFAKLNPKFRQIVDDAWADHDSSYREVRSNHRPGTQATVVYDLMNKHARLRLADAPGVTPIEHSQTLLFDIEGDYTIRFKKLKRGSLGVSTNQTQFSDEFFGQLAPYQMALFQEPTSLVIGYTLNATKTGKAGVYVMCPNGDGTAWNYELEPPTAAQQPAVPPLPIPIPPSPRVAPKTVRPAAVGQPATGESLGG